MLTNLVFKKDGEVYVSTPVKLTGDSSLYLEFQANDPKGNVRLFQSSTNRKFVKFKTLFQEGEELDIAINGVIKDMWFRVTCDNNPTFAQILMPDE